MEALFDCRDQLVEAARHRAAVSTKIYLLLRRSQLNHCIDLVTFPSPFTENSIQSAPCKHNANSPHTSAHLVNFSDKCVGHSFVCSGISCYVHVISMYYVRKGSQAFLNFTQTNEVRNQRGGDGGKFAAAKISLTQKLLKFLKTILSILFDVYTERDVAATWFGNVLLFSLTQTFSSSRRKSGSH